MHKKYSNKNNVLEEETPIVAAYIIQVRVLNLLYVISKNLRLGFLNIVILFRPLMESVLLSEYFLIIKDDPSKQNHLKKWFREEKAPMVSNIRKDFENYCKDFLPNEFYQHFSGLLFTLHDLQSKSIHNSYNDVNKLFAIYIDKNQITHVEYEYKESLKCREVLQWVLYLESVLLTVVLSQIMCFEILESYYDDVDIEELNRIHKELFNNIENRHNESKRIANES